MRILIAGILGGIAMYVWASVAHVATPLGSMGLSAVPNEAAVTVAMHRNLGDRPGLYIVPYMAGGKSPDALKTSPTALLAYQPPGAGGMTPGRLGFEFGLEVAEALLLALVLSAASGFGARMGAALAVGLTAAMATNFSYWNWYGFSLDYTLANAFTELVKFVLAGLVIAWWLGRGARTQRS
jgi:hypothetical protein